MTLWTIEPHDSLIVRDGRPFQATPGARAVSLPFPLPATTSGMLRTLLGMGAFGFDDSRLPEILQVPMRGPLLVQLNEQDDIKTWYAPAPADCVMMDVDGETETIICHQALPVTLPEGALTSLTGSAPIGISGQAEGKESTDAPAFWSWNKFADWLEKPFALIGRQLRGALGIKPLDRDTRTHVAIDPQTQTAQEGALFTTSGLVFTLCDPAPNGVPLRLALAVECGTQCDLPPFGSLGGERRVSRIRAGRQQLPECPPTIIDAIVTKKHCRVILLTPAWFKEGYLPTWLLQPSQGVTPRLRGIACKRPQVISGWDYRHHTAKPTRRLAPSGSVFFLELDGTPEAIRAWAERLWMQCISDSLPVEENVAPNQYRLDGFGVAALGTWDGAFISLEEV